MMMMLSEQQLIVPTRAISILLKLFTLLRASNCYLTATASRVEIPCNFVDSTNVESGRLCKCACLSLTKNTGQCSDTNNCCSKEHVYAEDEEEEVCTLA